MRGLTFPLCGLALVLATATRAAECPGNPDALGTSRTIVVDPTEHPLLGAMQYRETLPLEDHEVVLTFDDGPLPPRSTRVLEILAHECVRATYFMVGKMARTFPDMVRRIHEAGHTIGTHSFSHPLTFHKMPLQRAEQEIDEGIASVTWAMGDGAATAPFFRIPGLLRSEPVERYLASQHIQVWSADFPADDWTKIGPAQVYARALQRIEANHKGMLLLHDIQPRTVAALPYLLRELKRRGYRIVQVVPATPDLPKTATAASDWIVHGRRLWPQTPIFAEVEPELPAPSPTSFGVNSFDTRSVVHGPVKRQRAARGQVPLPPVPIWPHNEPTAPPPSQPAVLPAPSPQDFGYPTDARPSGPRASRDLVPETNGRAGGTRGTFPQILDSGPTGSIGQPALSGPFPADKPPGTIP